MVKKMTEDFFTEAREVLQEDARRYEKDLRIMLTDEIVRAKKTWMSENQPIASDHMVGHKCITYGADKCQPIEFDIRLALLQKIHCDEGRLQAENGSPIQRQTIMGEKVMTKLEVRQLVGNWCKMAKNGTSSKSIIHRCVLWRGAGSSSHKCAASPSLHFNWMDLSTDRYETAQMHPMELTTAFDASGNRVTNVATARNCDKWKAAVSIKLSKTTKTVHLIDALVSAEITWLRLENVFICPKNDALRGPHHCERTGCGKMTKEGLAFCQLTNMQVTNCGTRFKGKMEDAYAPGATMTAYDWSQQSEDYRLVFGWDFYDPLKRWRDMIENTSDGVLEMFTNLKTEHEVLDVSRIINSTSKNRSKNDKRRRELVKKYVERHGTSKEKWMSRIGHYSNYTEYFKTAVAVVSRMLMQSGRIEKALGRDITSALLDAAHAHNLDTGAMAIALQHKSTAEIDIVHEPTSASTKQIILIKQDDLLNNKQEKIKSYAERGLRFWILIRKHTADGAANPNMFHFHYFMIAFMYMLRNGFEFNSDGIDGGDRIVFFSPDAFLNECLPDQMNTFETILTTSSQTKFSAKNVMKNIKRAVSDTVVINRVHYGTLHPDRQKDIDAETLNGTYPPTLFIVYHNLHLHV